MLHASVRINAHFLIWTRSWFALIPLRVLVQIHYSSEMCRNYIHRQILWVNSCLHVYFHIVINVPKATPAEDLMNSADKSGWRPERRKSIFHLSWIQEHCAAWDDLLWSTDPIFQEEFLRLWKNAGASGLAWRWKRNYKDNAVYSLLTMGGNQGQGDLCMADNPENKKDRYTYVWRSTLNSAQYRAHVDTFHCIHSPVIEKIFDTMTLDVDNISCHLLTTNTRYIII